MVLRNKGNLIQNSLDTIIFCYFLQFLLRSKILLIFLNNRHPNNFPKTIASWIIIGIIKHYTGTGVVNFYKDTLHMQIGTEKLTQGNPISGRPEKLP